MADIWDNASSLQWDDKKFALRQFLEVFDLPQVVKITLCSTNKKEVRDVKPLYDGEVLILHKTFSTKKVIVSNSLQKYCIPLDCPIKINVKPSNLRDYYDGVQDVSKICPNFARVLAGYLSMENEDSLSPGQKIFIKEVDSKKKTMKYTDLDTGRLLSCPFFWNAQFIPLVDDKDYTLKQALQIFPMPFNIEFIESPSGQYPDTKVAASLINLKSLSVKGVYTETCVIASTKISQQKFLYSIPQQLNLNVQAAKRALGNSCPTYQNFCESIEEAIKYYPKILHRFDYDIKCHSVKQLPLKEKMLGNVRGNVAPLNPDFVQCDSSSGFYESIGEYQSKETVKITEQNKGGDYQSLNFSVEKQYQSFTPVVKEGISPTTQSSRTDDTLPPLPEPARTAPSPPIPDDLTGLTVEQLHSCLETCGMVDCARIFKKEYFDGEMFMSLTEEILKDLQIRPMQRHKIMKIINGWRPKVEPTDKDDKEITEKLN